MGELKLDETYAPNEDSGKKSALTMWFKGLWPAAVFIIKNSKIEKLDLDILGFRVNQYGGIYRIRKPMQDPRHPENPDHEHFYQNTNPCEFHNQMVIQIVNLCVGIADVVFGRFMPYVLYYVGIPFVTILSLTIVLSIVQVSMIDPSQVDSILTDIIYLTIIGAAVPMILFTWFRQGWLMWCDQNNKRKSTTFLKAYTASIAAILVMAGGVSLSTSKHRSPQAAIVTPGFDTAPTENIE